MFIIISFILGIRFITAKGILLIRESVSEVGPYYVKAIGINTKINNFAIGRYNKIGIRAFKIGISAFKIASDSYIYADLPLLIK